MYNKLVNLPPRPRARTQLLWRPIFGFNKYVVSNEGHIKNIDTDHESSFTRNNRGIAVVQLYDNEGIKRNKAVRVIVAETFLEKPDGTQTYDTVINMNGDYGDNDVRNLAWRTRGFAIKYHRQFANPKSWFVDSKAVKDIDSGKIYNTIYEAAMYNGVLMADVLQCTFNQRWYCPPTLQKFVMVNEEGDTIDFNG